MNYRSKRPRRVTMKMVARGAGVERSTVSRVLNGPVDGRRYAPETVARIKETAQKLGYRKNLAALALKGGRSRTIALVVADISTAFFSLVASHLDRLCRASGYVLLIFNSKEDPEIELDLFRIMGDRLIDGAVISPASVEPVHLRFLQRHVPHLVLFDRTDGSDRYPTVVVDNFDGARRAVAHLMGAGHRRIGLIGGLMSNPAAVARASGYRAALGSRAEKSLRRFQCMNCNTEQDAETAARALLSAGERRPTAVFSTFATTTIGIIRTARELRLRIPRDLSLMAFDDFPAGDLVNPPIDVVRQPIREIAGESFRLLLAQIEGTVQERAATIVLPVEIILRGSTAPPPEHALPTVK